MAQNTIEVRRDIERIRAELDQTLDALGDHVRPSRIAERRTRRIRGSFASARERVMGTASSATSSVGDGLHTAHDQACEVPQRVVAETQGNPLLAGMIAFGIGLLAGSLAPPTEMERQAVDAMSDQLEPVRRQASAMAESVKGQVTDAARESAEHLGDDVREAAHDVQSTAQSSMGAVKEQAQGGVQQVTQAGRDG
jgi:hypothetical protein